MIFLNSAINTPSLKDAATVLALIQFLTGGLILIFKWWIVETSSFKQRATLCNEVLKEEVAELFVQIFQRTNQDIPLRGQPPDHPDLMIKFVNKQLKLSESHLLVTSLYANYKTTNSILLFTTIIGLVLLLLSIFFRQYTYYIGIASIAFIFVQLLIIIRMNRLVAKLEDHETRG